MGGIVVTTFEKITAAPAFGHICCMIHLTSISFLLVFGTYFFYNSHSPFKALHWTISCFTMAFASFFIFIFTNITQQSVLFPTDHQAILDGKIYFCAKVNLSCNFLQELSFQKVQAYVHLCTLRAKKSRTFWEIFCISFSLRLSRLLCSWRTTECMESNFLIKDLLNSGCDFSNEKFCPESQDHSVNMTSFIILNLSTL